MSKSVLKRFVISISPHAFEEISTELVQSVAFVLEKAD